MAKLTLNQIFSGFQSNDALNDNFDLIEAAIENTISRDGTTPNQMQADLDLNNFNLLNQGNPITIEGWVWEGAYAGGTTYQVGDVVENGGSAYICIVETTGNAPPNATYWQLVASASLPSQSGNSGKYLTTDGAIASWDDILTAAKTYTANNTFSGDNTFSGNNDIIITAGTITGITDLTVADGGTGRSTGTTAHGVICAGTTPTGAQQTIASVGSAGQVLTSNGVALPTFQTITNTGSMVKIGSTQVISGSPTSVVFTTSIDSTYDHYILKLTNVRPTTDNVALYLRTTRDAGSTWDQAGTDYAYNAFEHLSNADGTSQVSRSNSTSAILMADNIGNGAAESLSGTIEIFSPSSTTQYTRTHSELIHHDNSATTAVAHAIGVGSYKGTTDAVDGFQIYFTSVDIMVSGSITLYGIAK